MTTTANNTSRGRMLGRTITDTMIVLTLGPSQKGKPATDTTEIRMLPIPTMTTTTAVAEGLYMMLDTTAVGREIFVRGRDRGHVTGGTGLPDHCLQDDMFLVNGHHTNGIGGDDTRRAPPLTSSSSGHKT